MGDEPVTVSDRVTQLDSLYMELTKKLDVLEYQLVMKAVSAALHEFQNHPWFDDVRVLAKERQELMQQRTNALKESIKLQKTFCNEATDVH